MSKITVSFSSFAEEDLEQIADAIAVDNPSRAVTFIQEIRVLCDSLSMFPKRHAAFPLLDRDARIVPFGNYIILYRVTKNAVMIERIVWGSRELTGLLSDKITH